MRPDGRELDQLRPYEFERGFAKFAEGSCLLKLGDTHMLVTATVEERVPPFMKGKGSGWVTAEYSMLPRSGRQRNDRSLMKPNGRSMEIQRLIGRTMRAIMDLEGMGEKTITLDCDAIRADGGTRCAAITAGFIALSDAVDYMLQRRMIKKNPIMDQIAAISVGIYRGQEVLDLNYDEDSEAGTDMNIVMTGAGKFVEVQGTAEQEPFAADTLGRMLKLAKKGCDELFEAQRSVLGK
ncbi:MAG: ribonuclease PH [Fimbriimonas sp.]|jgi:ribonuclease PH|nr:ribonuclease PH [Fimbriimonadales bacterium]